MCVVALRIDSDMLCPGLPTRDFGCRLPPRPPRLRSHSHTKTGVRLRCTPTRSPISARRALLMSTSRAHIPHGSGVPTWHMHSRARTGLRRRPGRQTNSVLSLSLSLSTAARMPFACRASHRVVLLPPARKQFMPDSAESAGSEGRGGASSGSRSCRALTLLLPCRWHPT